MTTDAQNFVYAVVAWHDHVDGTRNFPGKFVTLPGKGDTIDAVVHGTPITLRVDERRFAIDEEWNPATVLLVCTRLPAHNPDNVSQSQAYYDRLAEINRPDP